MQKKLVQKQICKIFLRGVFLTIYFCDKKKLPQNILLQKWIVKKTAHKINRCKNKSSKKLRTK